MTQKQFQTKHGITAAQFCGSEKIEGWLDLSGLTSIPEGFNPTVEGGLDLSGLTSIPEGFNPTVGGWLDLSGLTSIPEGFNPTVGEWLDLRGLTSVPEGFNPTVGGQLDLRGLTSVPEGFNPTVGGWLDLSGLTSIPEGFNPTVGGRLDLSGLTSIPEGFNPTVGGEIYYKNSTIPAKSLPLIEWGSKFLKCDGRFSQMLSHRGKVWKLKDIGRPKIYYLVTDGNGKYAHGATIKAAKADLMYKISNRDTSRFKGIARNKKVPFAQAIEMYRTITGACAEGVKSFVQSNGLTEKPYSPNEIIRLTAGHYGHKDFVEFFA